MTSTVGGGGGVPKKQMKQLRLREFSTYQFLYADIWSKTCENFAAIIYVPVPLIMMSKNVLVFFDPLSLLSAFSNSFIL